MDSVKQPALPPKKSRLARTFAKVLHIRPVTGITPVDGVQKVKLQGKVKDNSSGGNRSRSVSQSFKEQDNNEKLSNRAAIEALLAKVFASLSTIKAAYAQLQIAQSPYDADEIQSADQIVVSQLQTLSEVKQIYLKKQFDFSPESTMGLAEIQEQKSLVKIYEIMGTKLESQTKLKDSEITFLREKLDKCNKHNRSIEKKLNSSGLLSVPDSLCLSSLTPSHFTFVLRNMVKSIRSFVRLMVNEMDCAGWDIDAAVTAIAPGVVYWKTNHKCFALESFVCRELLDAFHHPNFSPQNEPLLDYNREKKLFFDRYAEMKSIKGTEFITQKPESAFAKFCQLKYSRLVHLKMEFSFFGDLNHRNSINAGEFPNLPFFSSFVEMAKRVWLLHCLAFSFIPHASIFQISKNSIFSEIYMESVSDEAFLSSESSDLRVAFTTVPGFRIGKTVIQSQVYLSKCANC